jgi:hypothetical protein
MDFDSGAALVLTYCTSLHALKDCGHLQPGETLVVLGAAGGVGISADRDRQGHGRARDRRRLERRQAGAVPQSRR